MGRAAAFTGSCRNWLQNLRTGSVRLYGVAANSEPDRRTSEPNKRTSEPPNPRTPERLLLTLLLLAAACSNGARTYEEELLSWRAEKDAAFKSGDDSPLPEAQRPAFTGLSYFDIDPRMRVPASLVESPDSSRIIEMDTTAGNRDRFRVIGRLEFTLHGEKRALTAYVAEKAADTRRLFVPFGDTTNRGDTYGGGRYLDLSRSSIGVYDLDFNRAYNPFCVYDARWECPIPPRENRLPIEIRAGEKMPAGKKLSFGGSGVRRFGSASVWFKSMAGREAYGPSVPQEFGREAYGPSAPQKTGGERSGASPPQANPRTPEPPNLRTL